MSEDILQHSDHCHLCKGDDVQLALSLKPTALPEAYVTENEKNIVQPTFPLDLYLCSTCGSVEMLDYVDPSVLFSHYLFRSGNSSSFVEYLQGGAHHIVDSFSIQEGSRVVEIGSNDGSTLRAYKERGMQVLGIDPAQEIANEANASGIETLPEFFTSTLGENIRETYGPAKVVVANNVFAHSVGLADIVGGVKHVLDDDGIFSFEVSYLGDILEKSLWDTVYHEHIFYHSLAPLDYLFRSFDMEFVDVERVPSKGGSIRGFVQHTDGPHTQSQRYQDLLAQEQAQKYTELETFDSLGRQIECSREHLRSTLEDLSQKGARFAGYGISPTVNTLMHHFSLDEFIPYLITDNERKHGLYSPGQHLPIYGPEKLYDDNPSHAVVLAWNHAQKIMGKHESYKEKGNSFIIPLPEVQII